MLSKWAYKIAREQRRDVETMAANLDAARAEGKAEGRIVGLEEAAGIVETRAKCRHASGRRHVLAGSTELR